MTAPPRPPRLRSVPNTSDAPPPEVHFIEPGRHHSVPPIRVEAYHGIIGDYVSTIAPTTESDPVAVLVQCLSWAGCHLGRSVYLRHGTTQHYPMVWPLIIGKTSVARKGTSEADSINPLTAIDGIPRRRNGMTSGEGVIDAFLPSDRMSRHLIRGCSWSSPSGNPCSLGADGRATRSVLSCVTLTIIGHWPR